MVLWLNSEFFAKKKHIFSFTNHSTNLIVMMECDYGFNV